jgi:hypothetical protein
MADVEFHDIGEHRDGFGRLKIEPVTRVDFEAELLRTRGPLPDPPNSIAAIVS